MFLWFVCLVVTAPFLFFEKSKSPFCNESIDFSVSVSICLHCFIQPNEFGSINNEKSCTFFNFYGTRELQKSSGFQPISSKPLRFNVHVGTSPDSAFPNRMIPIGSWFTYEAEIVWMLVRFSWQLSPWNKAQTNELVKLPRTGCPVNYQYRHVYIEHSKLILQILVMWKQVKLHWLH